MPTPTNASSDTPDDPDDKPRYPKKGFTTVGFSDGSKGQRGELDKYCGLERSFYFVGVAIMYGYRFDHTIAS